MTKSPLDILNRFGMAAHQKQQKRNMPPNDEDDQMQDEVQSKATNPGVTAHPPTMNSVKKSPKQAAAIGEKKKKSKIPSPQPMKNTDNEGY